jgi:hypothetical protein
MLKERLAAKHPANNRLDPLALQQRVLHYSATTAGLAFLVVAILVMVFSSVGQAVVTRIGASPSWRWVWR